MWPLVIPESGMWRGYMPAGETTALSSLVTSVRELAGGHSLCKSMKHIHDNYLLHYSTRHITQTGVTMTLDTPQPPTGVSTRLRH